MNEPAAPDPHKAVKPAELEELVEFIATEAQLLDDNQLDEWRSLFDEHGHYWVPGHANQTDPNLEPSLAYEDALLLRIRVERLRHPQAHSQHPPSRCVHVLQRSRLISTDGLVFSLRTPFTYAEQRADRLVQLAGVATHHLQRVDEARAIAGTLRIKLKRVDLLGAQAALPMIQLFP